MVVRDDLRYAYLGLVDSQRQLGHHAYSVGSHRRTCLVQRVVEHTLAVAPMLRVAVLIEGEGHADRLAALLSVCLPAMRRSVHEGVHGRVDRVVARVGLAPCLA